MRFSPMRGRMSGSGDYGLQYPSPFFDIAHTYMPATVKMMFRWCRYYFLVNPLINAVVFKMSEYPVTDIIFDTERPELKQLWSDYLLDHLRYRSFQVEVGLDYHTYGNALVSIFYPFVKYLECPNCGHRKPAKDSEYRFQNFQFIINCEKCGHHGPCKTDDHYIKAPKGIRLLRWNPEDVDVRYNELTGDYEYYYEIPTTLKNDIIIGKKSTVESVPQLFIEALKQKKAVVFSKENVFHFKRPTLAGKDRGWGTPMILPVLKDTFYLQVLRKAQEAIALEHIVPLRILFPQAGSATSDPYTSVNLQDWRDQVASELRRWRADNNYMPIMPLPLGNQTIGGDGRALLLSQEVRVWSEQIVAGMGVPTELIFGGLSYSGSNVALRMLENTFLGYLQDHLTLLKWVIKRTAAYLGWSPVRARFKPFKMADDLQRKAYLFQLNSANKLSDESLLADADFDSEKEDKIMEREATRRASAVKKQQLLQAEIQGESQMVQMKWQQKAQNQQMKEQMAIQNEMAKDQAAFQGQMQMGMMQQQVAMQQGGEAQPPPDMQPLPRHPELLEPPKAVQSPLSLRSVQPLAPNATGESLQGKQNVDLLLMGRQLADKFSAMDPAQKPAALTQLKMEQPELHDVVLGLMMSGGNGPTQAGSAAARPLPEQKPARRGPEASLI
jgi:predicted RNA-binding Zn-ribbon protein involved in translation (DUF1610 family)